MSYDAHGRYLEGGVPTMQILIKVMEVQYELNGAQDGSLAHQCGTPESSPYDTNWHLAKLLMVRVYGADRVEAAVDWWLDCNELPTPEELAAKIDMDQTFDIEQEWYRR